MLSISLVPIPPELRYCTVCKSGEVEDECHFIHDCKPLEQFWQDLFGTALQHQPGFSAMSATEKMVYLFESDNVHVINKKIDLVYLLFSPSQTTTALSCVNCTNVVCCYCMTNGPPWASQCH